jgi:oligogalacturonide lyase
VANLPGSNLSRTDPDSPDPHNQPKRLPSGCGSSFDPDCPMIIRTSRFMLRAATLSAALSLSVSFLAAEAPPKDWVDPDTGHRVHRITDEAGTLSLYFNDNPFTPDGKQMVYTTPHGISVLDLATFQTREVVPGPVRIIVVGRKTPTVFYTKAAEHALYGTNLDTGETKKLADLPPRGSVATINADETLAAGAVIVGEGEDYNAKAGGRRQGQGQPGVQPVDKVAMMEARLAARLPMEMYTIDLRTGKRNVILKSTDWLNHFQFSPTDPTLLMYCHEGSWWKVDRIWTIRTDGTGNMLVHKRTMGMEASGHEFWSQDGKTIYYDLHMPFGTSFYLATYNVENGERTWYHLPNSEWSIHYNATPDGALFCGDGTSSAPDWCTWATPENNWIFLFRPERVDDSTTPEKNLPHPGVLHSERLVNMSKHGYLLEPNVFFSPDQKLIFFRSNMFGPTYVFAVEVAKAAK